MAKVQLTIRIDPDVKKDFQQLADSKRPPVSLGLYIEWLIKEEIERNKSEAGITTPANDQESPPKSEG